MVKFVHKEYCLIFKCVLVRIERFLEQLCWRDNSTFFDDDNVDSSLHNIGTIPSITLKMFCIPNQHNTAHIDELGQQ